MMQDELRKARKFRALRAKNLSRLVTVPSDKDWTSYYVFYRPYFLVATATSSPWQAILSEIMEYVDNEKVIPLDAVFLLDKNVVLLLSPHQKAPFTETTGLPFPHRTNSNQMTGFIKPYSTDAPLAFLMAWLCLFRTSFFEDESALGLYLQSMVNSAMTDLNLLETYMQPLDLIQAMQEKGLWHLMLQLLREQFPKREPKRPTAPNPDPG